MRSGCEQLMYKTEQAISSAATHANRLRTDTPWPCETVEVTSVPAHAISFDVVRMLEESLWRRGSIQLPRSCTPLWFLAETERNVALWRRGYSLIAVDDFEFLVDLPELIAKRERQLAEANESNPFHLSPIESGDTALEVWQRELTYLQQFRELLGPIQVHLAALCAAARQLQTGQSVPTGTPSIVLPERSLQSPS